MVLGKSGMLSAEQAELAGRKWGRGRKGSPGLQAGRKSRGRAEERLEATAVTAGGSLAPARSRSGARLRGEGTGPKLARSRQSLGLQTALVGLQVLACPVPAAPWHSQPRGRSQEWGTGLLEHPLGGPGDGTVTRGVPEQGCRTFRAVGWVCSFLRSFGVLGGLFGAQPWVGPPQSLTPTWG